MHIIAALRRIAAERRSTPPRLPASRARQHCQVLPPHYFGARAFRAHAALRRARRQFTFRRRRRLFRSTACRSFAADISSCYAQLSPVPVAAIAVSYASHHICTHTGICIFVCQARRARRIRIAHSHSHNARNCAPAGLHCRYAARAAAFHYVVCRIPHQARRNCALHAAASHYARAHLTPAVFGFQDSGLRQPAIRSRLYSAGAAGITPILFATLRRSHTRIRCRARRLSLARRSSHSIITLAPLRSACRPRRISVCHICRRASSRHCAHTIRRRPRPPHYARSARTPPPVPPFCALRRRAIRINSRRETRRFHFHRAFASFPRAGAGRARAAASRVRQYGSLAFCRTHTRVSPPIAPPPPATQRITHTPARRRTPGAFRSSPHYAILHYAAAPPCSRTGSSRTAGFQRSGRPASPSPAHSPPPARRLFDTHRIYVSPHYYITHSPPPPPPANCAHASPQHYAILYATRPPPAVPVRHTLVRIVRAHYVAWLAPLCPSYLRSTQLRRTVVRIYPAITRRFAPIRHHCRRPPAFHYRSSLSRRV